MSENQPDTEMVDHSQPSHDPTGLEESLALAKKLEEEEQSIQAEVDKAMAEEEQKQNEGESISSYVNQAYAQQLIEMGFPKNVAEKALFMTLAKGGTTETALEWISEHSEDPDFNEELKIVGKDESSKGEPKVQMSKEEKLRKAKELQDAIRKKRAEEEKRLQEEQEKNRVRIAKEMTEAKRKMEEQQQKIALEVQKREKQEFLSAKQQMLEQLRRDKEERFGKKIGGGDAPVQEQVKPAGPQGIELVKHGLKTVRTLYTEERQPGVAKTCFKTCHVYLTNLLKDPNEEKFKRINLGNQAFQTRVGKITGGLALLKGAGFVEQADGTLFMEKFDENLVKEAHRLIENNL